MKKDVFTARMFRRLAVPAILSSLGLAFADMADAVVVGQSMGAVGLAAISLCLPLYMVFNVFMHGLGSGGSVRFARLMGEGRPKEAVACFNRVMQAGLFLSILIAIVVNVCSNRVLVLLGASKQEGELFFAARTYLCIIAAGAPLFFLNYMLQYFLRSDGGEKLAGFGFLAGNVVDIVLNVVFVIHLKLGTTGAAWATLIGLVVSILCYLPGILPGKNHTLCPALVKQDYKEVLFCFRNGVTVSSQYLFQMLFLLLANHALMRMAGENGVAVFDMVQNASYLVFYLYEGSAKAMQPLVSMFAGEKDDESIRRARRLGIVSGSAAGGVAAAFIALFPGVVCQIFGLEGTELVILGKQALRLFCLGSVFAGVSILLETFYQSIEKETESFVISLLRGCLVLLPCTFLFSLLPLTEFFMLYPTVEIISLFLFELWRLLLKRNDAVFDKDRVLIMLIHKEEDVARLMQEMEVFCTHLDVSAKQFYFAQTAAQKICTVIMKRAFPTDGTGEIKVTLVALENGDLELHIRDNAVQFNPMALDKKKAKKEDDLQNDSDARDIFVIKKQAKDFFYRHYQGFNSLVVRI